MGSDYCELQIGQTLNMQHLETFGDERQLAHCSFCGGETGTRDHCPSRVLLDEPFPENLPVVPACEKCNSGFSADEEYLACFLGCVLAGSTEEAKIGREKVRKILAKKPALKSRLAAARSVNDGTTIWQPEIKRLHAVITKLAQGHALYTSYISPVTNRRPILVWCRSLR
jgi:hypothetical protein